jgi:serine/threonine protein kinase/polyhydroxyalkanoate synthesis regulator phasin
MALNVGDRLGDYEIAGLLGAGGMGRVYKVRNVISDRVEAMKVLLPDLAHESELADRFIREIKVLASFDHPHIAALYTASRIDNQLVMIMEFVEGVSLGDLVKQGRIPVPESIDYICQALSALSYAHERGVVHRDIKPSNMMLTPQGVIKLMDFGIARSAQDHKLTVTGATLGSLFYMSPEQVKATTVDARSDLYSVGITLYEMVTGARPFHGDSSFELMAAQIQEMPRPPIEMDPTIPAPLNDVILLALEKEPARRFQTAQAFRSALESVRSGLGLAPAAAPSLDAESRQDQPTSFTMPMQAPPAPAPVSSSPTPQPLATAPAAPVSARPAPLPPAPTTGSHRALYMAIGAVLALVVIIGAATQLPRWLRTRAAATATTTSTEPSSGPSATTPQTIPDASTSPNAQEASGTVPSEGQVPPPSGQGAAAEQANQNPSLQASAPTAKTGREGTIAPAQQVRANAAQRQGARPAASATPLPAASQAVEAGTSAQTPAAAPQAAAGQSNAAALEELQDRMVALGGRANAAKASVENLRQQMQSQGLGLRSDMAAALSSMEQYMDMADAALAKGDADAAKRDMDRAERQIEKLEKFLGG